MGTGLTGLPSRMPPLTTSKPAVYRDNLTWLEQLHGVRAKLNELIDEFNKHSTEEYDSYKDALTELAAGWRNEFMDLRVYLDEVIEGVNSEPLIHDPTTGELLQRVTTVNGNVFDNSRIFSYFAAQYDELGLTAAEFDALDYSARHFDMAPLYPTLNDVWEP